MGKKLKPEAVRVIADVIQAAPRSDILPTVRAIMCWAKSLDQ
jgi:hypothetical protein